MSCRECHSDVSDGGDFIRDADLTHLGGKTTTSVSELQEVFESEMQKEIKLITGKNIWIITTLEIRNFVGCKFTTTAGPRLRNKEEKKYPE